MRGFVALRDPWSIVEPAACEMGDEDVDASKSTHAPVNNLGGNYS